MSVNGVKRRWKMALKSGKQFCAKPGCRNWAMKDSSGFCFSHNPGQIENRRQRLLKVAVTWKSDRPEKRVCGSPGCRMWAMKDGSGFCFMHNPNLRQKQAERKLMQIKSRRENKPPPDRICLFLGCPSWNLLDGSGFCFSRSLCRDCSFRSSSA